MPDTLSDRLDEADAQSLDRRRLSPHSRRALAEAIRADDTDTALRVVFEILTGETPAAYPLTRDISGTVRVGAGVFDGVDDDESVAVSVTLTHDDGTVRDTTVWLPTAGSAEYRVSDCQSGGWTVTVGDVRAVSDRVDATQRERSLSIVTSDGGVMRVDRQTPVGEVVEGAAVGLGGES